MQVKTKANGKRRHYIAKCKKDGKGEYHNGKRPDTPGKSQEVNGNHVDGYRGKAGPDEPPEKASFLLRDAEKCNDLPGEAGCILRFDQRNALAHHDPMKIDVEKIDEMEKDQQAQQAIDILYSGKAKEGTDQQHRQKDDKDDPETCSQPLRVALQDPADPPVSEMEADQCYEEDPRR